MWGIENADLTGDSQIRNACVLKRSDKTSHSIMEQCIGSQIRNGDLGQANGMTFSPSIAQHIK